MTRQCTTQTRLGQNRYPSLHVFWQMDDDQNGWTGRAQIWTNSDTKAEEVHYISLRQGLPLGGIYIEVDEVPGAGCWSMGNFEGAGLTERDLQWAALFAREAIQRKLALRQSSKEGFGFND